MTAHAVVEPENEVCTGECDIHAVSSSEQCMRTSIESPPPCILSGVISAKNQHLTFGCLRHILMYIFHFYVYT